MKVSEAGSRRANVAATDHFGEDVDRDPRVAAVTMNEASIASRRGMQSECLKERR